MKAKLFLILIAVIPSLFFGQTDTSKTKQFGFIGTIDLAYNFQDNVLNPGIGRKWAVGASFTNEKRQFVAFVAVGFKGFKFNAYSPTFRESFSNDIMQHYVPIDGMSEDSLIAAKMNGKPGKSLWGTYAYYFQVGFILNKKIKPSFSLHIGTEHFLLFDNSFTPYEDPQHGDIDYVGMRTLFYEFKIGGTIPFKNFSKKPRCLNLNIGYKWIDYGALKFSNTPLNAYTWGYLEDKYNTAGKITVSLLFIGWTNWE